jgi:hypothetical protein
MKETMVTELRKVVVKKYIADDGTEFEYKSDCETYERNLSLKKYIKQADDMRIKELDDVLPLDCNGMVEENSYFYWFSLNSKKDFDIVRKAYDNATLPVPKEYPTILCVESNSYHTEEYNDDCYGYLLENIMADTKKFWKKLGYEVSFTKK